MLDNNIITQDEYNVIYNRMKPIKSISDYLWSDIVDGYSDWCNDKYTIVTAKGYRTCIMKFISYITKVEDKKEALNVKFKPYTFQSVNRFIGILCSDGLQKQTINKIKYSMIVLSDYLNSIGIEAPDITSITIHDDISVNNIIPLIREDEIYEVAETSDLRSKICILLCYEGALKRQELSKVRFEDFDYNNNQLVVYNEDGKFERVCLLSDKTIELVKEYKGVLYEDIEKWNKSRIRKGKELREDYGFIFQNIKTTTPSYSMMQTLFKNSSKEYYTSKGYEGDVLKNKISNFTFETLRNSRRLYLLAHGNTVNQVMNIIGDKNYMTTYRFQKYVPIFYPELFKFNTGQ